MALGPISLLKLKPILLMLAYFLASVVKEMICKMKQFTSMAAYQNVMASKHYGSGFIILGQDLCCNKQL